MSEDSASIPVVRIRGRQSGSKVILEQAVDILQLHEFLRAAAVQWAGSWMIVEVAYLGKERRYAENELPALLGLLEDDPAGALAYLYGLDGVPTSPALWETDFRARYLGQWDSADACAREYISSGLEPWESRADVAQATIASLADSLVEVNGSGTTWVFQ